MQQLVVNFENTGHFDLVKMLLEQLQISDYTVIDDAEDDDLEDAYLLKLADERRNDTMISAETLLYNLKQAGKLD